jgi:hypothetical protein
MIGEAKCAGLGNMDMALKSPCVRLGSEAPPSARALRHLSHVGCNNFAAIQIGAR